MSVNSNMMKRRFAYRIPNKLDGDVGEHEGLPRVCLRGTFPSLIKSPLLYEYWHHLFSDLGEDGQEQEDTEHLVLKSAHGVVAVHN